ncbi:MAG: hypothetical protein EOP56_09465 [Sphingobacteriales bacterium]|nr:MAG: hypothetical protein EOP56_09465 [Sphingobacteriales bacterium]
MEQNRKESWNVMKWGLGLFIAFVIFRLVTSDKSSPTEESHTSTSEITNNKAFVISQNFVKSALKSPSSADFGGMFAEPRVRNSGNEYIVNHYVDSKNSFGAEVRSRYTCTLTYISGDWADPNNWICNCLVVDGKVAYGCN